MVANDEVNSETVQLMNMKSTLFTECPKTAVKTLALLRRFSNCVRGAKFPERASAQIGLPAHLCAATVWPFSRIVCLRSSRRRAIESQARQSGVNDLLLYAELGIVRIVLCAEYPTTPCMDIFLLSAPFTS